MYPLHLYLGMQGWDVSCIYEWTGSKGLLIPRVICRCKSMPKVSWMSCPYDITYFWQSERAHSTNSFGFSYGIIQETFTVGFVKLLILLKRFGEVSPLRPYNSKHFKTHLSRLAQSKLNEVTMLCSQKLKIAVLMIWLLILDNSKTCILYGDRNLC